MAGYFILGLFLLGILFLILTWFDDDHVKASNAYWDNPEPVEVREEAVVEAPKKARKPRAKKVAE